MVMKEIKRILLTSFLIATLLLSFGCIEEFTPETIDFKDVLVVEAAITNRFENQTIKLSRTANFEATGPSQDSNAEVTITTDNGITYNFFEAEPGIYKSITRFSAQPNINYKLSITTTDGEQYISETAQLTASSSEIEDIKASVTENKLGEKGFTVSVTSFDPSGESQFYGYEFEETYQIIARFWSPFQFVVINRSPFSFFVARKTEEDRVCFNTIENQGRVVTSSDRTSVDRITDFPLTFIALDDIKISSRYSVLVRQYTQSSKSFNFYRIMNDFSNVESVFSQIQPGLITGNISSVDDPNKTVIGFFEVSSVTEKRVFINREDVTEELFDWPCSVFQPQSLELMNIRILDGSVIYFEDASPSPIFFVTETECGDCRSNGSNVRPDFWID
jgi:hypothetical protein